MLDQRQELYAANRCAGRDKRLTYKHTERKADKPSGRGSGVRAFYSHVETTCQVRPTFPFTHLSSPAEFSCKLQCLIIECEPGDDATDARRA